MHVIIDVTLSRRTMHYARTVHGVLGSRRRSEERDQRPQEARGTLGMASGTGEESRSVAVLEFYPPLPPSSLEIEHNP